MSRRVSSREDLFLSALDMYTLLSFVFIGFAFVSTSGMESAGLMDLPVAVGGTDARSSVAGKLVVSWSRSPAQAGTPAGPGGCKVKLEQVPKEIEGAYRAGQELDIPCHPGGFGLPPGDRTSLDDLGSKLWERAAAGRKPEVIVSCRRTDFYACASLQWILHEARLRPLIVARSPS
ncbi:hypothetical protein WMF45_44915 [Sorangium sp. So ce448]|uniref:hypothetical protein n=1 Tax=Sorangium sp. So ce448 TaxID=3133314 RepID=UPI003F5F8A2D